MATSSNSSFDNDLESSVDSPSINIPVDADLPAFEVLPRRHWVGKIVDMRNVSGITIASGILHVLRTMDVPGSDGPLGDAHVAIQVSRTFVEQEAPDEWRYCIRTWPIAQVFYNGVSLFHHQQRDTFNSILAMRNRSLGQRTRSYDSSSRIPPTPVSTKSTVLLSDQSINSVAGNACCSRSCVQHFPRQKIKVLRMRMYFGTSVQFRRHIKLDVHRQFHVDSNGRNVVTLEGNDVCSAAW